VHIHKQEVDDTGKTLLCLVLVNYNSYSLQLSLSSVIKRLHTALDTMSTSYTKLSRPHPAVWQIDLTAPPDNRLTPDLLASLAANLDTVEAEWRKSSGKRDQQGPMSDPKTFGEHKGAGALVLTGSGRFFSNGLDYAKAMANPRFFEGE
jgi:hypothetical protein